jgi:hypothetical protein
MHTFDDGCNLRATNPLRARVEYTAWHAGVRGTRPASLQVRAPMEFTRKHGDTEKR